MKTMRTNPPLGKNSASTPTMAPNTYLKAQQVSEGHANTKINKIKISYYIGLCDSSEFFNERRIS